MRFTPDHARDVPGRIPGRVDHSARKLGDDTMREWYGEHGGGTDG